MAKTVVIIGHNEMSRLGLIRAAGKLGCEVWNIVVYFGTRPRIPSYDMVSRYVTQTLFTPARNEEALLRLLLNKAQALTDKAIIVPCSDFAAATVDLYRKQLEPYYIVPGTAETGEVARLMNKSVQKELADSLGVTTAKGWIIPIAENGNYTLPEDVQYPVFPKALLSVSGGKLGMVRCGDEASLRVAMKELVASQCSSVLLEQYLPIDKEYACIGYSNGEKVVIPGVLYLNQLAHGIHKGVAVAGELLAPNDFEPVLEAYKQFVRKSGFVGLFDIDFFLSYGQFYFCEMNMRVGASCDAYTKAGVNVLKQMLNSDVPLSIVESPRRFVNNRMVQLDWIDNFISNQEMMHLMTDKNGFIYDEKDILPVIYYFTLYAGRMVKKLLKTMFRKMI